MRGWWQRLWRGGRPVAGESARAVGAQLGDAPGGGGEWQVVTAARLQESREGQVLEYPGRTVECPRGHRRVVPTRFDRPAAELLCSQCGRRYPFRDG